MAPESAGDRCLIRCGGRIEAVVTMWSRHDSRIRRPVGVCDRCGHVQIATLFEEGEYADLNGRFFTKYYDADDAELRAEINRRKIATTVERIADRVDGGGRLLDIGAGIGWASEVCTRLDLDYHAVEPDPAMAGRVAAMGATLAASTVDQLLPEWADRFDVIMLRHTLEHLLDPIGVLAILAQCLGEKGFLYVVVPNFSNASPRSGFTTDYLRPVHISYYTRNKLEWSLSSAGLVASHVGEEAELWAIATRDVPSLELQDEREANRRRIRDLKRVNRTRDFYRVVRILGSRLKARLGRPVVHTPTDSVTL